MSDQITIVYTADDQAFETVLSYSIMLEDNIQTIVCKIPPKLRLMPIWMSIGEFTLRSIISGSTYTPLYADNNSKNLNTASFIDTAYAAIMKKERLALA
jgi:hypothetical protein